MYHILKASELTVKTLGEINSHRWELISHLWETTSHRWERKSYLFFCSLPDCISSSNSCTGRSIS
ncbi:hypothetical protein Barb6_03424 [Bacteroidales bacterium Barb6]|nr:hypothetical protein Barb6_03424 [Bacteroidales bacterium Barb6]